MIDVLDSGVKILSLSSSKRWQLGWGRVWGGGGVGEGVTCRTLQGP